MYNLHYELQGDYYKVEASTLEEILSICVDIFQKNGEPIEIYKDKELVKTSVDIYKLFNKRYY